MEKKCVICGNLFETEDPDRKNCEWVKCEMKFNYRQLKKKGIDPVKHYNDMIEKGAEKTCRLCGKIFKPSGRTQFFNRLCRDCYSHLKKEVNEKVVDAILKNPREFLDKIKEK